MTRGLAIACVVLATSSGPTRADDDLFEASVRPLLVGRCQKCHGEEKAAGGLRLDSRAAILSGGDSGPSAVEGKPDESLIVRAIEQADDLRMPPKGKLSEADVRSIRDWIARGLPWTPSAAPDTSKNAEKSGPLKSDLWSLRPVRDPRPLEVVGAKTTGVEIDRFLMAEFHAKGLKPSPPADRRTLIQRASHDLTGLPPTLDEVEEFVRDESPDSFARLIDRLLASPAYGEKWGRHWLDLARYADTAGENSDHPTPHSWRYRNWVIDAFNRDMPYDEFIRKQIAGDRMASKSAEEYAEGIVATGFLAIARRFGHDIDKDVHLMHEDVIDTLGKTFLGLSIACARCHDHKYDPITARDYYALSGILQSTRFSFPGCEPQQQPRDLVPLMTEPAWKEATRPHREAIAAIDAEINEALNRVETESRGLFPENSAERDLMADGSIPDGGGQDIAEFRAEVEPGSMLRLVIAPMGNHGADSTRVEWEIAQENGPGRWSLARDVIDNLLAGNPHDGPNGERGVWWFLDARPGRGLLPESLANVNGQKGLDAWRNGDTPSVFANARETPVAVWTNLPARSIFVHPGPDGAVAIGWLSPVAGPLKIRGKVIDAHPGGPDGVAWSIDRIRGDRRQTLQRLADLNALRNGLARRRADLIANAPRPDLAYAVADANETDSPIHLRGDPEKKGPVVPRRWLEVLGGQVVEPGKGSGRLDLANWLASPDNPLASRVMVNRIWQHHFGRGLVATPSDFGTRGMPPSHPDLLEWLTARFLEDGRSIKAMHRRILLSDAYQRSSNATAEALAIDPENALLSRFSRRRLTAEEIRDGLRMAGGSLDRAPGGPHPFPPESTWGFSQHVPFSAVYETNRRSVYIISLRNRRHPFLGLFDGADPNATTSDRQKTTVPTQALFFLNDPFFHEQAALLEARLPAGDEASKLNSLYRIALQRQPNDVDRATASSFLARYEMELKALPPAERSRMAWSALARAVLASNEFLYVE